MYVMRLPLYSIILIFCAALLLSCEAEVDGPAKVSSSNPTVVEVRAIYDSENNRHLFQTDVNTIPSGWTTFRLINASPMVHFLFLDHLPGDRTSEELLSEVSPIFQEVADLIAAGKEEEVNAKFSELPPWFSDIVFRGGPGFVSPTQSTEATLYMEPGNYVMECYIRTADGVYHWNLGMYKDLHVTDETTTAEPPSEPTLEVTITDAGLEVEGDTVPGQHLVAVHFQQETPALIAKDVHLIRLDKDANLEAVTRWMDFMQPNGLISTADNPGPAVFLGGVHEMPAGNTAYFSVTLQPGEFAWISEQPATETTYLTFTVAAEDRS